MKPLAQIEAEVAMWQSRQETINVAAQLLQYQARDVQQGLAAAQAEIVKAQPTKLEAVPKE